MAFILYATSFSLQSQIYRNNLSSSLSKIIQEKIFVIRKKLNNVQFFKNYQKSHIKKL